MTRTIFDSLFWKVGVAEPPLAGKWKSEAFKRPSPRKWRIGYSYTPNALYVYCIGMRVVGSESDQLTWSALRGWARHVPHSFVSQQLQIPRSPLCNPSDHPQSTRDLIQRHRPVGVPSPIAVSWMKWWRHTGPSLFGQGLGAGDTGKLDSFDPRGEEER